MNSENIDIIRQLVPSGDERIQLRRTDIHGSWVHGLVEVFNIAAAQLDCSRELQTEMTRLEGSVVNSFKSSEDAFNGCIEKSSNSLNYAALSVERNAERITNSNNVINVALGEFNENFNDGTAAFKKQFDERVDEFLRVLPRMISKRVNDSLAIAEPDRRKTIEELEARILTSMESLVAERMGNIFNEFETKLAERVKTCIQSSEKRIMSKLNETPKKRFFFF